SSSTYIPCLPYSIRRPPPPPLFPYTTLFRSQRPAGHGHLAEPRYHHLAAGRPRQHRRRPPPPRPPARPATTNDHELLNDFAGALDRKSTRLNSSHEWISYAVLCLKKEMCAVD